MYTTIVEAVLKHGDEYPDKIAFAFKKDKLTYRQLCEGVKKVAYKLKHDFGINPQDKVMLSAMSKRSMLWCCWVFSI